MLSYIGKSSQLAPALKGSVQVVANGVKATAPGVKVASENISVPTTPPLLTPYSMSKRCPTGALKVSSGIGVSNQVRFAHTDIQVPDFSAYRRDDVKDSRQKSSESANSRRSFTYMLVGGGTVASIYSGKTLVTEFISSMGASADVLALAKIEVNLGDIPEGKSVTFKWRGKPLFVKHRTDEEISTEVAVDVGSLRDPEHDDARCSNPKFLIVIGVCTHLGCVPIADAGDFGGYYCPCHGSHYDSSGRIRKGPAPLNLEVPYYEFQGDLLVVG